MAITEPLVGKFVKLRCVDISDAKFTLEIRNDPELTKYIPKVNGTIETQKEWISKQRTKDDDYFFIIENKKGESVGTIGCYDINVENECCETGRFISRGESYENTEASLLLMDFVFFELDLKRIISNVDAENSKVINYNKKFGTKYDNYVYVNGIKYINGDTKKQDYIVKREKIYRLLQSVYI